MKAVSNDNFGPLIAYLVPGAVALLGFSPFSPTLREWFGTGPAATPSIGGFLYVTIASIAVGMTLNAVRWMTIDTIHAWTGISTPPLDFGGLGENVEAFTLLIEIHYRHYQFYANTVIALAAAYGSHRFRVGASDVGLVDVGAVTLCAIFFGASRDTLRRYHSRCQQLLHPREWIVRP